MNVASVSQLKDKLSSYLETVRTGDSILVTDRRRPVALIQPLHPGSVPVEMETLMVLGAALPPARVLAVEQFLDLPKGQCAPGLTAALTGEREER